MPRYVVGWRRDIDHIVGGRIDEVIPESPICAGRMRRRKVVSQGTPTRRLRRRALHRSPHRLADHHRRLAFATFRGIANLGDDVVRGMFRQTGALASLDYMGIPTSSRYSAPSGGCRSPARVAQLVDQPPPRPPFRG